MKNVSNTSVSESNEGCLCGASHQNNGFPSFRGANRSPSSGNNSNQNKTKSKIKLPHSNGIDFWTKYELRK